MLESIVLPCSDTFLTETGKSQSEAEVDTLMYRAVASWLTAALLHSAEID